MKKRLTDEQIVRILQEAQAGMAARNVCRKHKISEQTFYRWKSKFGGMEVSEVKRLKELERENAELKRMVAEQALDIRMLKDINAKKVLSLPERRRAATYLRSTFEVSERRACQVLSLSRSSYRYGDKRTAVDVAHQRVVALSDRYDYWGYRKIHDLLRGEIAIGRERVRLIRRREGLQVRSKRRIRCALGQSTRWLHRAEYPNHVWSYDFVHDQTMDGRRRRFLTVVNEFHRAGLAIPCARSLTAIGIIRTLSELVRRHLTPVCLRGDNGPEFIAEQVKDWLRRNGIDTHYIDRRSPWQNAYNESINSIFRTTCLDRWAFETVSEAKVIARQWPNEHNTIRPHGYLAGRSPSRFIKDWDDARSNSSTETSRSLT